MQCASDPDGIAPQIILVFGTAYGSQWYSNADGSETISTGMLTLICINAMELNVLPNVDISLFMAFDTAYQALSRRSRPRLLPTKHRAAR